MGKRVSNDFTDSMEIYVVSVKERWCTYRRRGWISLTMPQKGQRVALLIHEVWSDTEGLVILTLVVKRNVAQGLDKVGDRDVALWFHDGFLGFFQFEETMRALDFLT